MKTRLMDIGELIVSPFKEWSRDNAAQLAAAIAYYTIFSLAPILIIALAVAGQFFTVDVLRNQLMAQVSALFGLEAANLIGMILQNSSRSTDGFIASALSFVILLFGASGVFNQVQFALNTIWGVPTKTHPTLWGRLKNRFFSFLMVLAIVFLLPLFLVVSAMISSMNQSPVAQLNWLAQTLNLVILFVLMTGLFAMIFRVVPDKEITWKDVWLGAAVTSLLFVIGRYLISLYLYFSKSGSTYGAAGSLIVLLIWIYYSAQIFLLGAEFTQVFARKLGSRKNNPETPSSPPSPIPGDINQSRNS